ncbi:MAG: GNAT family N-acetyltransferase [Candidatus Thiodiazotropha sp.]
MNIKNEEEVRYEADGSTNVVQSIQWNTLEDLLSLHGGNVDQVSATNLYAMYRAPEWLECLDGSLRKELNFACYQEGKIASISAFLPRNVPLKFQISRGKGLEFNIKTLELLGGEPIGQVTPEIIDLIVHAAWEQYPGYDAIYIKSLTTDSAFWGTLQANDWKVGDAFVYMPDGTRPFHYVALPNTYDEFMKSFKSKQRFTLRKKLRKINEAFPGKVGIQRIIENDDFEFLKKSLHQVLAKSWTADLLSKGKLKHLENDDFFKKVISRGMMRSHVLTVDQEPCAFVVGYFYNGIYHYSDLAYDEAFSKYAPGIVLLLLVIEDLIENDQAKYINFGITDAQYKRVFGNRHVEDASLLILRPTLLNTIRVGLHRVFIGSKRYLSRVLKYKSGSR